MKAAKKKKRLSRPLVSFLVLLAVTFGGIYLMPYFTQDILEKNIALIKVPEGWKENGKYSQSHTKAPGFLDITIDTYRLKKTYDIYDKGHNDNTPLQIVDSAMQKVGFTFCESGPCGHEYVIENKGQSSYYAKRLSKECSVVAISSMNPNHHNSDRYVSQKQREESINDRHQQISISLSVLRECYE